MGNLFEISYNHVGGRVSLTCFSWEIKAVLRCLVAFASQGVQVSNLSVSSFKIWEDKL